MKIPFTDNPSETFSISMFGILYQMHQLWNTVGFWTLDIADADGNPLASGVKLVARTKLLRQYVHIPFELGSITELDPTRNNLSEFVLEVSLKNG